MRVGWQASWCLALIIQLLHVAAGMWNGSQLGTPSCTNHMWPSDGNIYFLLIKSFDKQLWLLLGLFQMFLSSLDILFYFFTLYTFFLTLSTIEIILNQNLYVNSYVFLHVYYNWCFEWDSVKHHKDYNGFSQKLLFYPWMC